MRYDEGYTMQTKAFRVVVFSSEMRWDGDP